MTITANSLKLFLALADDAANWSGQPLFDGTKEERGNLTQLKVEGLVSTFTDEGCLWVKFTEKGQLFAAQNGITDLGYWAR